jgi:hypothetical protein
MVEEAIVAVAAKQPVAAVMRAAAGKSALTAAVRLTTTYRQTILAARVPVPVMHLLQIVAAADIPAVVVDIPVLAVAVVDVPAVVAAVVDMPAAAAVDMLAAVVVDIGNL